MPAEELHLILGPDPLKDPTWCVMYFVAGDFAFPGLGWTDHVGAPEGLRDALRILDREGVSDFWFLDGPYAVGIRVEGAVYEFVFSTRGSASSSVKKVVASDRENSVANIERALDQWEERVRA